MKLFTLTMPGQKSPCFGAIGETFSAALARAGVEAQTTEQLKEKLGVAPAAYAEVDIEPPGTASRVGETVFCHQTFRRGKVLSVSSEGFLCEVRWTAKQVTTEVSPKLLLKKRSA